MPLEREREIDCSKPCSMRDKDSVSETSKGGKKKDILAQTKLKSCSKDKKPWIRLSWGDTVI